MNITKTILTIAIISFFFSKCGQKDYERILEVGITGMGIIDKVEDTNVTVNDNPQVRLSLTVYSLDNETFKTNIKIVVSRISIPRVGDRILVKYDPVDNQKVIYIEDDDITTKIEEELKKIRILKGI